MPGAAGAGKPGDAPRASMDAGAHVKPGGGRGNGGGGGNGNGNNGGGNGHGNGNGNGGGRPAAGTSDPYSPSATADTGGGGNGSGNGNGNGGRGGGGGSTRGYAAPTGGGSSDSGSGRTSTGSGSSSGGSGSSGGGSNSSGGGSGSSDGGAAPTTTASAGSAPTPSASTGSSSNEPRSTARRRTERSRRRAAADRRRAIRAGRASLRPVRGTTGTTTPARAAADVARVVAVAAGAPAGDSAARGSGNRGQGDEVARTDSPVVVRTFRNIVKVVPGFIKAIIGALAVALLVAMTAWFLLARNARFLRRQREKLVGEIGVLQGALLPNVPPELSRLEASVAYRPAEGLAAGGDFYDAFPLERGQVGIVVGDVAGHGKDALMHTALLRYTMRAYLEAGLEPRAALQVAGRVLDRGFDTLATVVLAVYDPERRVLRYATAGHPPPVFLGEADHVPVTRSSSPPIGAMLPTGLRQTTVSLPAGSAVCFFTDGLIEARRDGELIGRLGLVDIIRRLGPHAQAAQVLDMVAAEADHVGDDMAACMFRVANGGAAAEGAPGRLEELELSAAEPVAPILGPFLAGCGLAPESIERRVAEAERVLSRSRAAIVRVTFDRVGPPIVLIDPANVESLAAAQAVRAAS